MKSKIQELAFGDAPSAEWPDEKLVDACLKGDERAWSALIAKYKNLVYSVPLKYRMDAADAADIFQAVWMELFAELGNLRQVGALRSWLMTVAFNKSFQWKRKQQKERLSSDDGAHNEVADRRTLFPEWKEGLEREQCLREAMARLPERCQTMIHLLFFRDPPLPYAEVARSLGLAEGSIGFIRGRCLKKLRAVLEEMGF